MRKIAMKRKSKGAKNGTDTGSVERDPELSDNSHESDHADASGSDENDTIATKKKVGSSKQADKVVESDSDQSVDEPVIKKKRGKTKATKDTDDASDSEHSDVDAEVKQKKKGRAKGASTKDTEDATGSEQSDYEAEVKKTPKGNKKGVKAKKANSSNVDEEKSDNEDASASEHSDYDSEVKKTPKGNKKGGKGKKANINAEDKSEDEGNTDYETEAKKKKKGKAKVANNKNTEDGSDSEHSEAEVKKTKTPKGNKKGGKAKKANSSNVDAEEKSEEEKDYEVESVIDERIYRKSKQFLIRWKGYTKADDTWESEKTVNCPELIKKYKESAKLKRKKEEEDDVEDSKDYEVDKIIEVHFKRDGGREFLVSWKGYPSSENTWEPEDSMNCTELIAKFMTRVNSAKGLEPPALREVRTPAKRLTMSVPGLRVSKRTSKQQRVRYDDCE